MKPDRTLSSKIEAVERRLMTSNHIPLFDLKNQLLECINLARELEDEKRNDVAD